MQSPTQISQLPLYECALTTLGVLLALGFPTVIARRSSAAIGLLRSIAHRKSLSIALIGILALLVRLCILPICPIPHPFIHDDFSFLLAADTFMHGRLTNPTPRMWTHFEAIQVTMYPTYMSMYFPGQGLILATAKELFGNAWFGILVENAAMCASICWALQGWLPAEWALLGGFIAILRISLFSYWINTYVGAGALSALAGALVVGGLARFLRRPSAALAIVVSLGISVLALTRLYECMLLCIFLVLVLAAKLIKAKPKPSFRRALRIAAPAAAVLIATAGWLGYYDHRVNGSATILPYTLDRAEYGIAPYFIWQQQSPEPKYRAAIIRNFYYAELEPFTRLHEHLGYARRLGEKLAEFLVFFVGFAPLPVLFFIPKAILDRRTRLIVLCLGIVAVGQLIQVFLIPHYLAAFTVCFYALGLQAARHAARWRPSGEPVGHALIVTMVAVCVVIAIFRMATKPLRIALPDRPILAGFTTWYGPNPHMGSRRSKTLAELESKPGDQLAIVKYSSMHDPLEDWVYNAADIDASKVIWARDEGCQANSELTKFYKNRTVWLVQPDDPARVIRPYAECQSASAP